MIVDYCVCCGVEIPEGSHICYRCRKDIDYPNSKQFSEEQNSDVKDTIEASTQIDEIC